MKKTLAALLLLVSSYGCAQSMQAILFVSFSMPDTLLLDYLQQSEQYRIPLVFRGLYHGSFREMIDRLKTFAEQAPGAGVLIDPLWFSDYHITRVPTLVVGEPLHFDRISGNVSIRSALESIAVHGTQRDIARAILALGRK